MGMRRWRLRLAIAVLSGLLVPMIGMAGTVDDAGSLQQEMERALREERVTGVVWATLDHAGTIRAGAAGVSNATTREPMTPGNRMHVGSITKPLIAAGVLQLVSAGRIDLDAALVTYLPEVHLRNPWQTTDPVRVRHLIDHTAGLDDMRLWQLFSTRATPDSPLFEAFSRDPSVLDVRSRPGSQFSYSNMGYTLAAMVIEAVTRERYETYLDRELLQPLGMRDSTFRFTTQVGADADPRLAWGHNDLESPASALPVYLRPAGQFTTTANDLALFARFLMSDGSVAGRTLVKPELLRAMGRPSTTDAARAGLQVGYGLGLSRRDRHGAVSVYHDGSVVGFHAAMGLFPDATPTGRAFVVIQNTDGDGLDTGRFDAMLIRALGFPRQQTSPAPAPANIADWQGRYVPAPNRFAAFRYTDFLSDSARLSWDGRALRFEPVQGPVRVLTPAGGMRLVAHDRSIASHVLLKDQAGRPLLSTGLKTYGRVSATTYWLMVANLLLGLLGLLWFVLVVPVRALLRSEPMAIPGVLAAALLLLPVPLFLLQDYTQLGDVTIASVSLCVATALLPVLVSWQAWRSVRRREGIAEGRVNLIAAIAVLQWCVVLMGWGMLPFALWR